MVCVTSPGPLGFTYVFAMSAAKETVTFFMILFGLKSVSLALLPLLCILLQHMLEIMMLQQFHVHGVWSYSISTSNLIMNSYVAYLQCV